MGPIARMVAVAGLAAVAVAGTTVAASAATASAGQTSAVASSSRPLAMSAQSSGTHGCASYDQCVKDQNTFQHYGLQVGPIYYMQGHTCPGGAGCADGWYFNWWS